MPVMVRSAFVEVILKVHEEACSVQSIIFLDEHAPNSGSPRGVAMNRFTGSLEVAATGHPQRLPRWSETRGGSRVTKSAARYYSA